MPDKAQLDRIERMLKWLIIRKHMEWDSENLKLRINEDCSSEILDNLFERFKQLPDISDIIKGE